MKAEFKDVCGPSKDHRPWPDLVGVICSLDGLFLKPLTGYFNCMQPVSS